jgi:RNA polymerase sigma factor (sigma-70 family)
MLCYENDGQELHENGHVDLAILTPRQREVIEMHYASSLSFGAIAELLGVSRQAAEQCHARAIDRLRRVRTR